MITFVSQNDRNHQMLYLYIHLV